MRKCGVFVKCPICRGHLYNIYNEDDLTLVAYACSTHGRIELKEVKLCVKNFQNNM